ncbi:MAG TPA: type II secretion system protein [Candidatus Nealsonbacteria bacterium]|nr:type II secretion system protein [Candidatus Nealsonbacteria bacterium]HEB46169.1 type II secretion system protein [Candidatus Nealsonbacteria bacterium]
MNKGFTLIELLVVITIIGILAGIILVAMGSVREKAKDTKIESNMLQLQQLAENLYLDYGNYDNVDPTISSEIAAIENDIITQGGSPLTIKTPLPADTYCAYTSLNKTLDGQQVYYCTDYLFRNQQIGDPSIGCYDTCFVCPACLDSNGDGLMTAGPDPIPNELLNMFISSCWGQPASCNPSLDLDCNGIINILDVMSYSGLIPYPCL